MVGWLVVWLVGWLLLVVDLLVAGLLVGCWFVARSWWLVGRLWATKLLPTTWYHPVVGHKIASDYLVPPFLPPEISSSCGVVVIGSGYSVVFGP